METLSACPVCNNTQFSPYLSATDHTVSHNVFTIQQCNQCQFLFTNPRPDESEIGAFYESKDYISHHDDSKNLMTKVYNLVRDYTIAEKIKLINQRASGKGMLLDVGCGTGVFASSIQKNGWNSYGTEPDPGARDIAGKRLGKEIYESVFSPQIADFRFNVITMWHVLEHVHKLNETLAWLQNHLTDNGMLIIAVPNPESSDAKEFKQFWAAYDVPRHLYHFSKKSLKQLVANHGFEVKETLPMWFDSFYVSMLSTKYRNQKTDLPASIAAGIASNWKGRGKGSGDVNTSSIIYIIKKK